MASQVMLKIEPNAQALTDYEACKLQHKTAYIIFKVANKYEDDQDCKEQVIAVEKKVMKADCTANFVETFIHDIEASGTCRFAVVDLNNKLLFVAWSPDTARGKDKMIYASIREAFAAALVGVTTVIQVTNNVALNDQMMAAELRLGNSMKIFVTNLEGTTTSLTVRPNYTIQTVLKLIEEKQPNWMGHNTLLFAGTQLENFQTLQDYNIQKQSTLHLITKLKGPMTLHIKTMSGEIIDITLSSADTIKALKSEIEQYSGYETGNNGNNPQIKPRRRRSSIYNAMAMFGTNMPKPEVSHGFFDLFELVCNNQIIDQNEECHLSQTCIKHESVIMIRRIYRPSYCLGSYGTYVVSDVIKVHIQTITGAIITAQLSSNDTIKTLKSRIKQYICPEYELVCNNKVIDRDIDCRLFQTCVKHESTIMIRHIYRPSNCVGSYGGYMVSNFVNICIVDESKNESKTVDFFDQMSLLVSKASKAVNELLYHAKGNENNVKTLCVSIHDTIRVVKRKIEAQYKQFSFMNSNYQLTYGGNIMQDNATISHYHIRDGSQLTIVLKKQKKKYSEKKTPQLFLSLSHLNETVSLYKVNFNIPFSTFLQTSVRKYLLDLVSNFDYFINSSHGERVHYNDNSLLGSKCKVGDLIFVRMKENVPLTAKPVNDNEDAEIVPKMKSVDFDNTGVVTKSAVIQHKQEITETVTEKLLNINTSSKKLSKLIEIEPFESVTHESKYEKDEFESKDDAKIDLNLHYKLRLDLDFEKEMKAKDDFIQNMKLEIAESLNVDIDSIRIDSVQSGSVILLISIDEKGTTQVYKDNILESSQFEDWSINKCIRGKNMNSYFANTSKALNEQTKMWLFLRQRFPGAYNQMKQASNNKYNAMKSSHSALIAPLSFNQIAAIYLYTTCYLYKALNKSLRDGTSEFADFAVELISGINKLPMVWTKTYRGLGPNFTKYHSYIPNVYKKGNVVRWDGINSTSVNKNTALGFSDKWVLEIDGYHGRDIQPFSAYPSEGEVLYMMSSHFFITKTYQQNGKTFFKCKEMPFPWSNKAILWVDDKPNNNKGLMERLEKKGIMIIPRVSTHDAMQFIQFMEKVFLSNQSFDKFRIISDMSRVEIVNENVENSPTKNNSNAGAILVNELRKKGYNQQICIYTSNEQKAINACKSFGHEDNIKATTSTSVCFQFADY